MLEKYQKTDLQAWVLKYRYKASYYLKKNSWPLENPDDLKKHALLNLSIHERCRFKNNSKKLGDYSTSKILTCEDGVFLTNMALEGMGVLVRSIWDVQDHLKKGKLVQLLNQYPLETFGHLYAVIPNRRFLAPRVRAFLEFIVMQSKLWKL